MLFEDPIPVLQESLFNSELPQVKSQTHGEVVPFNYKYVMIGK